MPSRSRKWRYHDFDQASSEDDIADCGEPGKPTDEDPESPAFALIRSLIAKDQPVKVARVPTHLLTSMLYEEPVDGFNADGDVTRVNLSQLQVLVHYLKKQAKAVPLSQWTSFDIPLADVQLPHSRIFGHWVAQTQTQPAKKIAMDVTGERPKGKMQRHMQNKARQAPTQAVHVPPPPPPVTVPPPHPPPPPPPPSPIVKSEPASPSVNEQKYDCPPTDCAMPASPASPSVKTDKENDGLPPFIKDIIYGRQSVGSAQPVPAAPLEDTVPSPTFQTTVPPPPPDSVITTPPPPPLPDSPHSPPKRCRWRSTVDVTKDDSVTVKVPGPSKDNHEKVDMEMDEREKTGGGKILSAEDVKTRITRPKRKRGARFMKMQGSVIDSNNYRDYCNGYPPDSQMTMPSWFSIPPSLPPAPHFSSNQNSSHFDHRPHSPPYFHQSPPHPDYYPPGFVTSSTVPPMMPTVMRRPPCYDVDMRSENLLQHPSRFTDRILHSGPPPYALWGPRGNLPSWRGDASHMGWGRQGPPRSSKSSVHI